MKKVKLSFFKASGKWYEDIIVEIPEDVDSYAATYILLPKHRRKHPSMFMLAQNSELDRQEKEPYIVPKLFHPMEV